MATRTNSKRARAPAQATAKTALAAKKQKAQAPAQDPLPSTWDEIGRVYFDHVGKGDENQNAKQLRSYIVKAWFHAHDRKLPGRGQLAVMAGQRIKDWGWLKDVDAYLDIVRNKMGLALASWPTVTNAAKVMCSYVFKTTGDDTYKAVAERYSKEGTAIGKTRDTKEQTQTMSETERARYATPLQLQRNARLLLAMANKLGTDAPPKEAKRSQVEAFRKIWLQAPMYLTLTEGREGVLRPQNFTSARIIKAGDAQPAKGQNTLKVTPTEVTFKWYDYKSARKFKGDVDEAEVTWSFSSRTGAPPDHVRLVKAWNDSLKAFPRKYAVVNFSVRGDAADKEAESSLAGRLIENAWVYDKTLRPTANDRSSFTTWFRWNGGEGPLKMNDELRWAQQSMSSKVITERNYSKVGERWLIEAFRQQEPIRVDELETGVNADGGSTERTAEPEVASILMDFHDQVEPDAADTREEYAIPTGLPFKPKFDITTYMQRYRKGLIPGLPDSALRFKKAKDAYRKRQGAWKMGRVAELARLNADKGKDRPLPLEETVKKYKLRYDPATKMYL